MTTNETTVQLDVDELCAMQAMLRREMARAIAVVVAATDAVRAAEVERDRVHAEYMKFEMAQRGVVILVNALVPDECGAVHPDTFERCREFQAHDGPHAGNGQVWQ